MTSRTWIIIRFLKKWDLKWRSIDQRKFVYAPYSSTEIIANYRKPRFEPFFAYSGGILKHTWIKHNDICAIHRFAHKLSKSFLKHSPSFIGTLLIVFTAIYFATIFGQKFRVTRSLKIQKLRSSLWSWTAAKKNFSTSNFPT